ncbi:hypothetical protein F5Y10DRAFT_205350 [Nemania abortiva]|nr:hypothetical protein F5Y10DRAFT_205350 [Nemania abortiva]
MTLERDLRLIRRYEKGSIPGDVLWWKLQTCDIGDPECPPYPNVVNSGRFYWFGTHLQCKRYGSTRQPIGRIRAAAHNNAWPRRPDRWWKEQFTLYGLPFKEGDDMRAAAVRALRKGLFNRPSGEMRAIEARLDDKIKVLRQEWIEEVKAYCKKRADLEATKRKNAEEDANAAKK